MGGCAKSFHITTFSYEGDSHQSNQYQYRRQTPPSPAQNSQFKSQKPSGRQMSYWKRRIYRICGDHCQQITQKNMRDIISYMNLSQETTKKIYERFKKERKTITPQIFLQEVTKFTSNNKKQFILAISNIYFPYPDKYLQVLPRFVSDFQPYMSRNYYKSDKNEKVNQIANQFMKKQKQVPSQSDIKKWIQHNINLKRFRYEFLQRGLINDQKQAFRLFWLEHNNFIQNQQQKYTTKIIINAKWCARMNKYMRERYDIRSEHFNKNSDEFNYGYGQHDMQQGYFYGSHSRMSNSHANNRQYHQNGRHSQTVNVEILEKNTITSANKLYPQQIDNMVLAGNFQWQLRRNIRKQNDYYTITYPTYRQLWYCFGGGPQFSRSVIKGYISIRQYFVMVYFFGQKETQIWQLFREEMIKISSSDLISKVLIEKIKGNVCYHRNVGAEWEKFSPEGMKDKGKKVIDLFSETSFFVYMDKYNEELFITRFIKKPDRPNIGQMYESISFKIMTKDKQKQKEKDKDKDKDKQQKIEVCVLYDQNPQMTKFVVLNMSSHHQKRIKMKQFKKNFKLIKNELRNSTAVKKNRAGISNLGNTCYMNASLQAILSVAKSQYLENPKGELGKLLKEIDKIIRQQQKSMFPIDFKIQFDKHFQHFKGQSQHDAHQFCMCLFQRFQQDNKQLIQKVLEMKIKQTNKCKKCKKQQQKTVPTFMLQLPLRDFAKKQVKIDYITQYRFIQTVSFQISQQCTIGDWKKAFQKASNAKNYYLCQVQNGDIYRTFNEQDNKDNHLFKNEKIQNNLLITAYQTIPIESKQKLKKFYKFKTYKDQTGAYIIAKIGDEDDKNSIIKSSIQNNEGEQNTENKKMDDKIKITYPDSGGDFQQKIVDKKLLSDFPQNYPKKYSYIKLINYDHQFNQKIGRPFIFKIPSHYPVSTIRQALEDCISDQGYHLRVSPIGQPSKCYICQRQYTTNQQCLKSRQFFSPICYVQNRIQFVVVWFEKNQYTLFMKRTKYMGQSHQNQTNFQQYDNFDLNLKQFQKEQEVQITKCNQCAVKQVKIEHKQIIIHWPEILVLHLKRFTVKNGKVKKIHTKWKLQEKLKISNNNYNLLAVICHSGISIDYGHYTTVAGGVRYDDQLVTTTSYNQILPQEIYMLFYVKS